VEVQRRVLRIVGRALRLEPPRRGRFVRRACGGDEGLSAHVAAVVEEDAGSVPPASAGGFILVQRGGSDEDLVGTVVGPFRILGVLARGGMAAVYTAEQEEPRRVVALKALGVPLLPGEARRRFDYETAILARLRHPAIAQVHAAGCDDVLGPWYALELVEDARSLVAYADEAGLDLAARLALFLKVCDAVHHAHRNRVIHRDLKPSNILVDRHGWPKIIDFGVACPTTGPSQHGTRSGDLLGTPGYASPEQLEDPSRVDTRADVYSLGAILYELATGRRHVEPGPVRARGASRAAPRPRAVRPDLHADLEAVILTALAPRPDERYSGVAGLMDDLRAFLERRPVTARLPSVRERLRRWSEREPRLAAVSAALLVVLVCSAALAGYLVARWDAIGLGQGLAREREFSSLLQSGFQSFATRADIDGTCASFERALEQRPDSVEALAGLALTLSRASRHEDALARLATWRAARGDGGPVVQGLVAHAERGLRVPTTAGTSLSAPGRLTPEDRAPATGPDAPGDRVACFVAGVRLLDAGWPGNHDAMRQAEALLRRAVLFPGEAPLVYYMEWARAAGAAADAATIEEVVSLLEAGWPGDPYALFAQGLVLFRHDGARAAAALQRSADLAPEPRGLFHFNVGVVLDLAGRRTEAEGIYRRALLIDPGDARSWNNLAVIQLEEGRIEAAFASLLHALEARPAYAEAHQNLGRCCQELRRLEPALACFERAVALRPGFAYALNSLGNVRAALGDAACAEEAYRECFDVDPAYEVPAQGLNTLLRMQGDPAAALAFAREAVRLFPGSARLWSDLAFLLGSDDEMPASLRDPAGALEAALHAVELEPGSPDALLTLGNLLVGQGRFDEGLDALSRAAEAFAARGERNELLEQIIEELRGALTRHAPEAEPQDAPGR
jgi:serine/threonine protein kinase/tetratricopeptide (TPR) repeat protein